MKKLWSGLLFTSFTFVFVACGQSETENSGPTNVNDINLEPLEAELVIPESANPGDELTLQAIVTQGEEKVDDASEIIFEVWIEGEKSDSEMIEADLPGENGMYELSHEFTEEAIYKIQSHVTARGSHVMPVGEIIVGDIELEDESQDVESTTDHNHGEHEKINNNLSVDWNSTQTVSADKEETLSVQVKWKEDAWVEGDVQFEIWKEGDKRHEWIDSEEVKDGQYETTHSFKDEGDYHVDVHLKDEEIHDHVQFKLSVE